MEKRSMGKHKCLIVHPANANAYAGEYQNIGYHLA